MFNTNVLRIEAIDIARGISVIIMIMVHALWMYATKETQANSILGDTLHFLGKGTAAFLVLMGFSMSLSRRQNASQWALRGVLLLLAGFALNALKFIVPIVIFNTIPDSFIAAYGWQQPLGSEQYTFLLLTGDILTFAGISLMLMALAFPLLKSPYGIVVSLVLILSLTGPLRGLSSDVPVFGYLLELLFADNYQVYFPVFPWITCILFGLLFGRLYCIWDKSIDKTFKLMAISGALLMTLGLSLISYNFHYHFNNFFSSWRGRRTVSHRN